MNVRAQALHEPSRRRPEWREGEWVSFGRWGSWSFPRPKAVARPLAWADGRMAPTLEINGQSAERLVKSIEEMTDATDPHALFVTAFDMIVYALLCNYDLNAEEVVSLLVDGFEGLDPAKTDPAFQMLARLLFEEPVIALGRLAKSLPRVRADRTGTDPDVN